MSRLSLALLPFITIITIFGIITIYYHYYHLWHYYHGHQMQNDMLLTEKLFSNIQDSELLRRHFYPFSTNLKIKDHSTSQQQSFSA